MGGLNKIDLPCPSTHKCVTAGGREGAGGDYSQFNGEYTVSLTVKTCRPYVAVGQTCQVYGTPSAALGKGKINICKGSVTVRLVAATSLFHGRCSSVVPV